MTTVYFAHPMDQVVGQFDANVLITQTRFELGVGRFSAYLPSKPWSIPHDPDPIGRELRALVNETAQRGCDATVAVLPDGVPTLGTPAEIERSLQWGKPVIIVVGERTAETVQVTEWQREGALVTQDPAVVPHAVQSLLPPANYEPFPDTALRVKLEGGRLPSRGYAGDAGFDLYCSTQGRVDPGEYVEVPTEIRVALPPNTWGMLVGRSSTNKRGLLVHQAIIDQGYTGPMFIGVTNITASPVWFKHEDRLAQIIPMPLLAAGMPVVEIDQMPETDRGEAGFGSTGD